MAADRAADLQPEIKLPQAAWAAAEQERKPRILLPGYTGWNKSVIPGHAAGMRPESGKDRNVEIFSSPLAFPGPGHFCLRKNSGMTRLLWNNHLLPIISIYI
jgi:hypothetical protein